MKHIFNIINIKGYIRIQNLSILIRLDMYVQKFTSAVKKTNKRTYLPNSCSELIEVKQAEKYCTHAYLMLMGELICSFIFLLWPLRQPTRETTIPGPLLKFFCHGEPLATYTIQLNMACHMSNTVISLHTAIPLLPQENF